MISLDFPRETMPKRFVSLRGKKARNMVKILNKRSMIIGTGRTAATSTTSRIVVRLSRTKQLTNRPKKTLSFTEKLIARVSEPTPSRVRTTEKML